MSNPYIVQRRATCIGELAQTFHHIDAGRFEYLAELLEQADFHGSASLARRWGEEHRLTAERLRETA